MSTPEFRKAVDIEAKSIVASEPPKVLSEPAKRALAEAEARRKEREAEGAKPVEVQGRGGLDPARYQDWEVGGIAVDF
jgi:hypothetical protein